MEKILFLCVDLGTSFIKTGIYDIDGNCLIEQKEAVIDEKPQPGIVIQRGEKLFASVLRCIKRTVSAAGTRGAVDIQAICFTGQMAGFIGVDKDWNDITTWSCFIDRRYVPYADRQMAKYSELFLNISGTHSPLMAPKIEWFATEYPQEARKIVKYMMISSYVIGKLGNMPIEEAVMDHSFLSWTGLGDIRKGTWSDQICGLIGMDQLYLPRIAKSNEICAYLSKDMAGELGLKSGIPLVSGAGDKVAGSVGAAVLDFGDAIFEAGTYGAISVLVRDFRMNREADYYDIVPAAVDNYYAHKYIPGSGMTLDWFIQTFCPDMSVEEAFAYMEEKVPKIAPGCEGLSAVGLLGGSAMPFNGTVRGLFRGYTWSHKREHFYRALLESFAFDLALSVDSISEAFPEHPVKALKVIGGGAHSEAWLHILADVTGCIFKKLDREDVALWGTAILAGNAIGVFQDVQEIADSHVKVIETVEPDASLFGHYRKEIVVYKEMLLQLQKFVAFT